MKLYREVYKNGAVVTVGVLDDTDPIIQKDFDSVEVSQREQFDDRRKKPRKKADASTAKAAGTSESQTCRS